MNNTRVIALTSVLLLASWSVPPASAQPQPSLEEGRGMAWLSLGFQGDLGGSVNSSGIGTVIGQPAELNANTWGERYDPALIFRLGGAYNISDDSQLFGAFSWEQAEADPADAGLVSGLPLDVAFGDYQAWGIDAGYRHFYPVEWSGKPFVTASLGFQHVNAISVGLSSPAGFVVNDVPFYDDSWVVQWRIGTGLLWDINERFGWLATVDVKYSGVLSDAAGIGSVGFERINDAGNRWTLPIMAGVYVKF
jgi:hypothetical protein